MDTWPATSIAASSTFLVRLTGTPRHKIFSTFDIGRYWTCTTYNNTFYIGISLVQVLWEFFPFPFRGVVKGPGCVYPWGMMSKGRLSATEQNKSWKGAPFS